MEIKDIIKLIDAGFTKEDINKFTEKETEKETETETEKVTEKETEKETETETEKETEKEKETVSKNDIIKILQEFTNKNLGTENNGVKKSEDILIDRFKELFKED